ncbi:myrosinase 1-like [Lineus longissimus]|uniref:myrosinase 1-like n=1 Tax=Lineus longissimus TaxID=88925 RepID=UPI002B4D6B3B
MDAEPYLKGKFPEGFAWCTATSAYQVEGGWKKGGKGLSVWDTFTHSPGKIKNGDTGDIACDSYNKWKDDVDMLINMGVTHYRFSISWPRILPSGKKGHLNQAGVEYYNNLIDALIEASIIPVATLYHWDHPQALEDLGGWLNKDMADYFNDYARICFREFGDRVKWWITINEPGILIRFGYIYGTFPPGFKSNPGTHPYTVGKVMLMAHAKAWHTYDDEFRRRQKGSISMCLHSMWAEPEDPRSVLDQEAARRHLEFDLGWFAHPIYGGGGYPKEMERQIERKSKEQGLKKSRLPRLTEEEVLYIKGTSDFFALNHYTTRLVKHKSTPSNQPHFELDKDEETSVDEDWLSPNEAGSWIKEVPTGLRRLLCYIKREYGNPEVFITENGTADPGNVLDDTGRIRYIRSYLDQVLKAIKWDGCKVIGYTAWSLMDNFEWSEGYTEHFGLHSVDFDDPERKRTAKASALFYAGIIRKNGFPEIDFDL